jgi:arylformamidase
MQIFDISQEVFSCCVFPGDPAPQKQVLATMAQGSPYNLISFSMCAHNGTHVDAPAHFIQDGKTVDQLGPEPFVGYAYVAEHTGTVTAEDMRAILEKARQAGEDCCQRILIKGKATLSEDAARVLADAGIILYGNESQTVGPETAPMATHRILLGVGIVLLEGIRLAQVPEGRYLLSAAPLNLGGAEGAPCRALLLQLP